MKLDIEFVKRQFDQCSDNPDFVFCSNAGGSYVSNQVNKVLSHYNQHTRVQPYQRMNHQLPQARPWTALFSGGPRHLASRMMN